MIGIIVVFSMLIVCFIVVAIEQEVGDWRFRRKLEKNRAIRAAAADQDCQSEK